MHASPAHLGKRGEESEETNRARSDVRILGASVFETLESRLGFGILWPRRFEIVKPERSSTLLEQSGKPFEISTRAAIGPELTQRRLPLGLVSHPVLKSLVKPLLDRDRHGNQALLANGPLKQCSDLIREFLEEISLMVWMAHRFSGNTEAYRRTWSMGK